MRDEILELLNSPDYKPLPPRLILKKLNSNDFTTLVKTLNSLEEEHLIIHDERGYYGTLEYFHIYKGVIDLKDVGFGFVKIDCFEKDIFVKRGNTFDAMNGDEVLCLIVKPNRISYEGQIIEVIKRARTFVIGIIRKRLNKYRLETLEKERFQINIASKHINNALDGDIVSVIITDFGDGRIMKGKVDKVIGRPSDPFLDEKIKIIESGIETNFSSDVLRETQNIDPLISFIGRSDLTSIPFVTIDGDNAKDFDDAIYVEKINDIYKLFVGIADVSEYVKEGSFIDKEALNRSFSCYLPSKVIPMLPNILSDDLCSLKENELRYAIVVEMDIDSNGKLISQDIKKAVIKSRGRLTYNLANSWFESTIPEKYSMLSDAFELYKILDQNKEKRGYIEFDDDDVELKFDESGKCISVDVRVRKDAEKLIENFMIQCNETIASTIYNLDLPFIYRIHDEVKDEKLEELKKNLSHFNIEIPSKQNKLTSMFFKKILDSLNDDEISKNIVNKLLLKSMSKAQYSTFNIGHFALSLNNYTHFTSPIRRYSDLLVHRLIKKYLLSNDDYYSKIESIDNLLSGDCLVINENEKKITTLERDVIDIYKADYMSNFIGKTFVGRVSSIKKWGIYVELDNYIEGMISSDLLYNLGYTYNEEMSTWSNFYLTKEVKVKVIDTNKIKGQIDFYLLED